MTQCFIKYIKTSFKLSKYLVNTFTMGFMLILFDFSACFQLQLLISVKHWCIAYIVQCSSYFW